MCFNQYQLLIWMLKISHFRSLKLTPVSGGPISVITSFFWMLPTFFINLPTRSSRNIETLVLSNEDFSRISLYVPNFLEGKTNCYRS